MFSNKSVAIIITAGPLESREWKILQSAYHKGSGRHSVDTSKRPSIFLPMEFFSIDLPVCTQWKIFNKHLIFTRHSQTNLSISNDFEWRRKPDKSINLINN